MDEFFNDVWSCKQYYNVENYELKREVENLKTEIKNLRYKYIDLMTSKNEIYKKYQDLIIQK